ncbi:MAG: MFS transporter [Candidatus Binataceae bacterium]
MSASIETSAETSPGGNPAAATPVQSEGLAEPLAERLGAFRALRHRNFRLFFGGQFVSLIGTWMQSVAQGWLVLKLTNSALMLGVVSFAGYLPVLLVTLFAGVIVDHADRRRLIVTTQVLLMLSAFILAALTWAGVVRVEYVIILAAINGLVTAFDMPARQTFVVEMVGREDLPNAIALNSMIFNGARVVGPAVAGVLISVIGIAGCFFLNGLSYIAVIWSLLEMELVARELPRIGSAMFTRLREGFDYIWHHRASFYLLLLIAINAGFGMQYSVLIPVFARDVLHGGPRAYGFLLAAQGLGALLGAYVLASSRTPRGLRQNLIFGLFGSAAGIFVFGFSSVMWLSLLAQMLIGAGLLNYMATSNTMLQLFVSDELRGRVMSMYTLSFIGLAPIGSLEVGFIGERVSPQIAVAASAVAALVCGIILLARLSVIAEAQAARDRAA